MSLSTVLSLDDRGLDLVLGGGVPLIDRIPGRTGASILIRGPAGSGKTLLGVHIALAVARAQRGAIAYGCIELLPSELAAQVRSQRGDDSTLRVIHADTIPAPASQGGTQLHARLLELGAGVESLGDEIQRFWNDVSAGDVPPRVLVIDSLIDGYGLGSNASREFADAVCKLASHLGAVVVLLEECMPGARSPWVYAADTVMEIDVVSEDADSGRTSPFERRLVVAKHRFGPSDYGPHRFAFESPGGVRVYPRPSAWLEPWSESLSAGVGRRGGSRARRIEIPASRPIVVEGEVVAVHGPDLPRVLWIASGVVPLQISGDAASYLSIELSLPLGHRDVVHGRGEEHRRLGVAHPYLSAHQLLRLLLDEVRLLPGLCRIVVGDLRSLRSYGGSDGLRRALVVFCALMRRQQVIVVLYESAPSSLTSNGKTLMREPGLDEPQALDGADVSIEALSDGTGRLPSHHIVVVTDRRRGVVTTGEPHSLGFISARRRLIDLLALVVMRLSAAALDRLVVFGDAALCLHGVDLGRGSGDLDFFVEDGLFQELETSGSMTRVTNSAGGIPVLRFPESPGVEVRQQFPGIVFADLVAKAAPTAGSLGLRVASVQDLKQWKQAQLSLRSTEEDRQNDRGDLQCIEAVLVTV